ncbi:hypothetical protein [Emticicia sp. C21]|uniref:hypothetical protein n=1 Tax=Emticicia sp. C21 TaxID=2302915 RepID=UPI000E349718|nr:hypothetical protein [Emticicia sp. C21]RFS17209.1 hypothetical protein D0T08_05355 [Emticicia sp. C21]
MEYVAPILKNPIDLENEVSSGYQTVDMKSLSITFRLPVKQMHNDEEILNKVFIPAINAILLIHSVSITSFKYTIHQEKENLICKAIFFGAVDIAAVEKEWNNKLYMHGYTKAAIELDFYLSRIGLSRLSFYPASTFIAEY